MWRVRKALNSLERAIGNLDRSPAPEPEAQSPVETSPLPKGLWMAKEVPLAYVVVPKSACTTAGQFIYFADHGFYYHDDIHRLRYGIAKAGVTPEVVRDRLIESGDDLFTFSFVRDPYSRLVSGFLDKVLDLQQGYRPDIRDRLASDWGVQLSGDRSQVDNFRSFVRFVDYQYGEWERAQKSAPGEDHRENWQRVDIHWLRQSWYMRRGRRSSGQVDFIGRTETMNDDLATLAEHLELTHIPKMADMPRFGVGLKRDAPLEDYFDDETKAIVDRCFGPDFRLFGYPKVVGSEPETLDGFERAARFKASFNDETEAEPVDILDDSFQAADRQPGR